MRKIVKKNEKQKVYVRSLQMARRGVGVMLASTLTLSACVTDGSGRLTTLGGQQVVDPADSCSIHRQPIANLQRSTFGADDAITSLAVGAGAAVLIGIFTRDWKAALGGGAAAAGGTAVVSYINNKNQIAKGQTSLLTAIDSDAASDSQGVSRIQAAVNDLRACRKRQFVQLGDDIKAGRLTKEDAKQKFLTLDNYRKGDDSIVNEVLGVAEKRASLYTEARMQTLKTDNPEVALASYEVPNAHPPLPVMKIKKAAKLRAGQSADSSILATLPVGSEVQIKESTNGWNHVYFDGHDGFLPDSVLKDTGRSVSASPTKKTPDVTKLVNSIKATKAANEGASKELDTAADNVRTLLG